MDMRHVAMLVILLCPIVVVTVLQLRMVVLVGVPVCSMLPLNEWNTSVVVGDVVVFVGMYLFGMHVLRLSAAFVRTLLHRGTRPPYAEIGQWRQTRRASAGQTQLPARLGI